ncbi:MAG TPA: ABC transporter permease [Chloroflexota bacterium]|nr:ABC transporter permease [Chloroflexota bacterium]
MLQDARWPAAAGQHGAYPVPWLLTLPYPLRNLLRRWRGMVGMILGVGISLSIVMTIQAMSQAEVDIYTSDYLKSGADLYVITEGGTLIAALPGDTPGTIKHGRHVLAQVRGSAGVDTALGLMTWTMQRERPGLRYRNEPTELVSVTGVDGDALLVPNALVMKEGRWFRRADEITIGAKLSREKGLRVGDTLRLNDRDFTIVGIGRLRGAGFSGDAVAYMDYRAFQQRTDLGDVVSTIIVRTHAPELTRARILELDSLSVFDRAQVVKRTEEVYASAVVLRWIFNGLALGVGALFVSSMLGRSVAERRLEFATLRAIGIPTRTILLAVASEAVVISVIAGGVGIALSLLLGAWINGVVAAAYGFEYLYVADAGSFAMVLALGLALGVVSGLFPARAATRVDPVEVLREA